MSVVDRLDAAKHSLTGSVLAKSACKASSREVIGPKRKHVDCKFETYDSLRKFLVFTNLITRKQFTVMVYFLFIVDLIQCTSSDHISIPNLAEVLFERCANSNWTVVFKALITFHHLMSYGNEVRILLLIL